MTTISRDEVICSKCGAKSVLPVLHSMYSIGYSDLDGRLPENLFSYGDIIVQECKNCGYTYWDLSQDNGIEKEYLKRIKIRNKLLRALIPIDVLYKYQSLYRESIKVKNIPDAYAALLYAAWYCDDTFRVLEALRYRRKLAKLFDKLPDGEKENEEMILQHIDIMRRAFMFRKVIKKYRDFKPKDDKTQKIAEYEFKLCKRFAPGRHSMDEVFNKEDQS